MTEKEIYDTVIIGGGPAGYTSALYCARSGLKTVVVEKLSSGGQMTLTEQIDNYPGFENGIDGYTLGDKMRQGAERFGAETINAEVNNVLLNSDIKQIMADNVSLFAKTVIIATGARHRHLGLENETELTGRGVSYCALCDGMFYRDKTVGVVGGGNSAVGDVLFLTKICKKVILIHRGDALSASRIYHNQISNLKNLEIMWNNEVTELKFDDKLNGVKIRNTVTKEENEISLDGLFISIGREPCTELFKNQVKTDNYGYIMTDETTKTNVPGVLAVGDVRTKVVRQIVTAISDGAVASHYAEEYLFGANGG